MPITQPTDVLPDPVLTALAVELGTGGPYAADQIAPPALVAKDEFKYAKFGREDIKDEDKSKQAPGQPASEVNFGISYTAGSVGYFKLKSRIPDAIRANDPFNRIDARRTRMLTNKLRLGVERRLQALCHAASKTQTTPSTKWDGNGPTIRKNILAAKTTFRRNAGMEPNVIVLPPAVRDVVFADTTILDLLRYTRGDILEGRLPQQIENMMIVAPGAIIDKANPGAAADLADVWADDEVYYLYVDPTAGNDLEALTALRQVRSTATGAGGIYVQRYRESDQSAEADWVSVHLNQVEIAVADELILRHLDILT